MIYINNKLFYDTPGSCGTCEFYVSGSTSMCPTSRGICALFDEEHHSYINIPKRCAKIFRKAFKFPEGTKLIITANNGE